MTNVITAAHDLAPSREIICQSTQPSADPEAPQTTLFLAVDVEENGDGYIWRCDIEDQIDGYEAGEMGRGGGVSVEQAEIDCWEIVVDLLRVDGYSDEQIVGSV